MLTRYKRGLKKWRISSGPRQLPHKKVRPTPSATIVSVPAASSLNDQSVPARELTASHALTAMQDGGSGGFDDNAGYDDHDELPPLDDRPISFGNSEPEALEDESELVSQTLKRVKPEYVNFAKKAKRVDVRKLKETIWKELAIRVPGDMSSDDSDSDVSATSASSLISCQSTRLFAHAIRFLLDPTRSQSSPPTPPDEGVRVFKDVLSGLRRTYPKDKMDEISTSFCFICILHLANEEGLKINIAQAPGTLSNDDGGYASSLAAASVDVSGAGAEGADVFEKMGRAGMGVRACEADDELGAPEGELAEDAKRVGRLEWLQIAKDPKAGRSA